MFDIILCGSCLFVVLALLDVGFLFQEMTEYSHSVMFTLFKQVFYVQILDERHTNSGPGGKALGSLTGAFLPGRKPQLEETLTVMMDVLMTPFTPLPPSLTVVTAFQPC